MNFEDRTDEARKTGGREKLKKLTTLSNVPLNENLFELKCHNLSREHFTTHSNIVRLFNCSLLGLTKLYSCIQ